MKDYCAKLLVCKISVFLSLIPFSVFPQTTVGGKVVSEVSLTPIPFVNIAIPGTYYGTITNNDGVFSLTVPSKLSDKKLVFSCIGFQSDTIPVSKTQSGLVIKMEEKVNELPEVIVMPENTLRKLLQRAYDKIPQNYPVTNTRYKGFYRETLKDDNGNYISFGEAFIEAVRGSVNLRNDQGQIKILKSRGGYFSGKDSTTIVRFYGGVFQSTKDFIQNRSGFINPSNFKDYRYSVQKTDNFYKINFRKKDTEHAMSGYFLLDTLSLAYTEACYFRERDEDAIYFKKLDAENYWKFVKIDENYFLKYSYFKGEGFDKFRKKKFHHFNEYLATEISPNYTKKIPETEQVNFFDVFMDEIPDYSDNYWDGYTIVEADSLLKQNQLKQDGFQAILNYKEKTEKRKKFLAVISKLSLKYGITYSVPQIMSGEYEFQLPAINQTFTEQFGNQTSWSLSGSVGYFFRHNLAVLLSSENSLGDGCIYRETLLGFDLKTRMNSFGTPNYLSFKAGLGNAMSMLKLGTFRNSKTIQWGNKKLNASKISAFAGNQSWVFKPTVGFSRYLKGKSSWYVDFSYVLPFSSKEIIALKEKSGLFRKSAEEDVSEIDNQIFRDGNLINQTGLKTPNFTLTMGINLLR